MGSSRLWENSSGQSRCQREQSQLYQCKRTRASEQGASHDPRLSQRLPSANPVFTHDSTLVKANAPYDKCSLVREHLRHALYFLMN